jgi:hypothetical protein
MGMTRDEIKGLSDRITDTLGSLAYEIARRVMEAKARPEDWFNERYRGAMVRTAAVFVLTDYFLGKFVPRTYVIVNDGKAIVCTRCGMTSYHLGDVENKYCAHCKRFHSEYGGMEIGRSP